MPTISNSITEINALASKAAEKADAVNSNKYNGEIHESNVKAAEDRISAGDKAVEQANQQKQKAEEALKTPPTKSVPSDGKKGGSKTEVDQRELAKLQSNKRAAEAQVQQAQAAVETARQEADQTKTEAPADASLNSDQQQDMNSLLQKIDELKTMSSDPNADLSSQDFQKKLKEAQDQAKRLGEELPDDFTQEQADFWTKVQDGFTTIGKNMQDVATPKVRSEGNYKGFFEDTEKGFNKVIDHLQSQGTDAAVVTDLKNARDSVLDNRDSYLGGMTDSDDEALLGMLTDLKGINEKIGAGEDVTSEDIAALTNSSKGAADVLSIGGSQFVGVLQVPFQNIAQNLDVIKQHNEGNQQFNDFYDRYLNMFDNPANSLDQLQGISKGEVDQLFAFAQQTDAIKQQYRTGQGVSPDQLNQLIGSGTAIADNLENGYGFTALDPVTADGGGSSSNSPRSSSRPLPTGA